MKFPPAPLKILDHDSAGIFLGLHRALTTQSVIFVLGSGVSASVGAPTWGELLKRIGLLFYANLDLVRLKRDRPAQRISIALTNVTGESRAVAAICSDHNPLLAAQLIQNCVKDSDWKYLVRKIIYENTSEVRVEPLRVLGRVLRLTSSLNGIVNFNYDDLLERELPSFGIDFSVLTTLNTSPKKDAIPVYHPHGWLPQKGGQDTDIILSETDYDGQSATPNSWSNVVQIAAYASHTAVFLGCSMTDPHLRLLLRATAATKLRPHFAFLPSHANRSDADRSAEALFDNDLVSMRVKPIRYPVTDRNGGEHDNLWYLLRLMGDALEDESALHLAHRRKDKDKPCA